MIANEQEITIKEEGSPSPQESPLAGGDDQSLYQEGNASMLDELREEMEGKYREKEIPQDFELKKYL